MKDWENLISVLINLNLGSRLLFVYEIVLITMNDEDEDEDRRRLLCVDYIRYDMILLV